MTTDFILAPGEEFIQCPYNTAHQITNARLITHLDKCRKAYLKGLSAESRQRQMKICRYNALHHVPKPEINLHEARCGDAFSIVRHVAFHNSAEGDRRYDQRRQHDRDRDREREDSYRSSHSSSSSSSRRHSTSSSSSSRHQPETKPYTTTNAYGLEEEDWEAESQGYTPGYDPEVKLKKEVIIYNPGGLTKSERKKFRNEVRQKAQEMSLNGEPVEFPTASSFDVKPNVADLKIKSEGRSSPLEPGEIEDDDEYNYNQQHSRHDRYSAGPNYQGGAHGGIDYRPSASSSRHQSSYSRPGSSKVSWTDSSSTMNDCDDYPDSDDFPGTDPYM